MQFSQERVASVWGRNAGSAQLFGISEDEIKRNFLPFSARVDEESIMEITIERDNLLLLFNYHKASRDIHNAEYWNKTLS